MRLLVKQGERTINECHFDKGPICIGRHTSQVILPGRAVSRQHAVIQNPNPGVWIIEDLGSSNKTYLNNVEIQKSEIKTGDTIRISDFHINVDFDKSKGLDLGDTIKLDKAELYHQELLNAMTPRLPYRADTYFGESLKNYIDEKHAVALYTADNEELTSEKGKIFLSDGSHTYYLFLALIYRGRNMSVVTNSLSIAGEYAWCLGKINKLKFPSNGIVDANYGGLFELKEEDLAKELTDAANIFISCGILDSIEGPWIDATRAVIRRKAIESGCPVTILCDYHTLSHDPKHHHDAPMFTGIHIEKWHNFIRGPYSCIITTPHPDMPESYRQLSPTIRGPVNIPDDKPHNWQRYCLNAKNFASDLGNRFIEVDTKTQKALQYKTIKH
ncbi:MAG: FHA domain-containing protein [Sedimentisphaerales bacterium]